MLREATKLAAREHTTVRALIEQGLHGFLAIVMHRRVFDPPTPLDAAIDQVEAWLGSPALVLLAESDGHWPALRALLRTGKIAGPKAHDARIEALCMEHGVRALGSADRDFGRFPDLAVTKSAHPGVRRIRREARRRDPRRA